MRANLQHSPAPASVHHRLDRIARLQATGGLPQFVAQRRIVEHARNRRRQRGIVRRVDKERRRSAFKRQHLPQHRKIRHDAGYAGTGGLDRGEPKRLCLRRKNEDVEAGEELPYPPGRKLPDKMQPVRHFQLAGEKF